MRSLSLIFAVCFLSPGALQAQDAPLIALDKTGLISLQYRGLELLQSGSPTVNRLSLQGWDGSPVPASTAGATLRVDLHAGTILETWTWGSVRYRYTTAPGALNIGVTVTNHSAATLESLELQPLVLKLPDRPSEYDGVTPMLASNVGDPSALSLHTTRLTMELCNEDIGRPLIIGFPWALDRPANLTFPLFVYTGRDPQLPDSLPTIDRPVYPGESDHFTLAIRFGPPGTPSGVLAGDLYRRFAAAYPFHLKWTDRRPIGELFISTAAAGWPKNPRGWLQDASIDVTTPEGRAEFRRKLLAYADSSVKILKQMNAQGMITWDSEGQEFPHATSYLGDPRSLPPEIQPVIDAYFKKFTDAGFRVGICVRPQLPVRAPYGKKVWQQEVADPLQNLIAKMSYARKRWGCTLFYIDSNGDPNRPLAASLFRKLAASFPDALLMPEHKNTLYHAYTAPYNELRGGFTGTRPSVRAVYPDAFDVIAIADGPIDDRRADLIEAVRHGDILLFRSWFDDPYNDRVRRIYEEAARPAP